MPTRSIRWLSSPPAWLNFVSGSRGASVPFGELAVDAIQRRPPNVHLHRDLSLTGGGISRRICAVRRACGIRDTAAPSKRSSAPRSLAHRRRNLAAHLCRSEGLRYTRYSGALQTFICTAISRHRRRNLAAHLCRSEGLRYGRKPNGSLTRPTKNFVGMPGLRCPHYFVSEYL